MRYSLDLRRVAARQHGLVTLEQAVADGWSRATWYRACTGGGLGLVAPAVAALPGAPDTPEQRILAAILARGGRAIASHRSAAYLWGVDIDGANPVDITGADRGCRPALGWVAAHNPRDVDDLRPVQRHGIPTTNPLRVLVDLGQVAPSAVTAALEHFLAEGLVDLRSVRAALVRHARKRTARDRLPSALRSTPQPSTTCRRTASWSGRWRGCSPPTACRRRSSTPASSTSRSTSPSSRSGSSSSATGGPATDSIVCSSSATGGGTRRCAGGGMDRPALHVGADHPSTGVGRGGHPADPGAAHAGGLSRSGAGIVARPRRSRARTQGDEPTSRPAAAARRVGQRPSQSSYSAWKWRTLVSW